MSEAQQFRKKPVVVEAMRYTIESCDELHRWANLGEHTSGEGCALGISIPTLEGVMVASLGDWIIKGVAGEFYPCKPDIFERTYEPVVVAR